MKVNVTVSNKIDISIFDKQLVDKATRIATSTIYAVQKQRIFGLNGGKDANNSNFGSYKNLSYLKYRAKKFNRNNSNINFTLSGEMSNEYIWGVNKKGNYSFGYQQKPNGNKQTPNGSQKAEYQEQRFKNLFALSKEEKKAFNEILAKYLK
jgi:hypothetical protein